MKWSEFKKQVDDAIEPDADPEILYIDVDDFSCGELDIYAGDLGLVITETERN